MIMSKDQIYFASIKPDLNHRKYSSKWMAKSMLKGEYHLPFSNVDLAYGYILSMNWLPIWETQEKSDLKPSSIY